MKKRFEILRRESRAARPWLQAIVLDLADENATVATALTQMNATPGLVDEAGKPVGRILWECSCLQKKCGACAMRINGVPALACDTRLGALGGTVRLEPLRKFPVVADLVVDRSVMHQNLKEMKLWLEEEATLAGEKNELAYEASRCLQCGCCLEVCPNFMPGEMFAGTAALPTAARLIAALPPDRRRALYKEYSRRVFAGCGKSLACHHICPAGIDVEKLLVNSNALAVWRSLLKK